MSVSAKENKFLLLSWTFLLLLIFIVPQLDLWFRIIGVLLVSLFFYLLIEPYYQNYGGSAFTPNMLRFFVLLLVMASIGKFIINLLNLHEVLDFAKTLLASMLVLFIPGALIVLTLKNVFKNIKLTFLEFLLMSYILSLFMASLMGIFLTELPSIIILIYIALAISFILLTSFSFLRKCNIAYADLKKYLNSKIFLLILGMVAILASLYPGVALIPEDITRHFSLALAYLVTPESITMRTQYPAHYATIAIILRIAESNNFIVVNSVLVFWSSMVFCSYYLFVSKLFGDRLASIASSLFLYGGGLGWIYVLNQAIAGNLWKNKLWHVAVVTNFDISRTLGPWLWFWFRPITIGQTILFYAMYSLYVLYSYNMHVNSTDTTLGKTVFILSVALLLVYHPSEIFLVLLLLLSSIFIQGYDYKKNMIKHYVIAITLGAFIRFSYMPQHIKTITTLTIILTSISILGLLFLSFFKTKYAECLKKSRFSVPQQTLVKWLLVLFIIEYIIAAYTWILEAENLGNILSIWILQVPLYHYPVVLGFLGLFALITLLLNDKFLEKHYIIIKKLLFVLVMSFIAGKILTYINESPYVTVVTNFIGASYFERRLVASLIYPVICIFASNTLLLLAKQLVNNKLLEHRLLRGGD